MKIEVPKVTLNVYAAFVNMDIACLSCEKEDNTTKDLEPITNLSADW